MIFYTQFIRHLFNSGVYHATSCTVCVTLDTKRLLSRTQQRLNQEVTQCRTVLESWWITLLVYSTSLYHCVRDDNLFRVNNNSLPSTSWFSP